GGMAVPLGRFLGVEDQDSARLVAAVAQHGTGLLARNDRTVPGWSGMERAIRLAQALDLIPLGVERAPGEDHDTGCGTASTVVDHRGNLRGGHALAPVGELDDGPDLEPFAGLSLDADVPAKPGNLSRDPLWVAHVPEAGVVRHRAEHVEECGLSLQIDRQLVA